MTPPELLVDAWLSAQNTFHASKNIEEERTSQRATPRKAAKAETKSEGRFQEFWQEWFGFWR
ncbi:MAG: hypothetical protein KDC27_21405 [Acidobacteria bacterium]|nr:hypothetical protein [Acidobacteriota bacterium]